MKVVSQTAMTGSEVYAELERIQKRDGELGFRAQKTVEYFQQNAPVDSAKDVMKKLEALDVPRLRDVHFAKLIDVLPKSVADVKVVLQGYSLTVTNENCKKIAEVLSDV